MAVSWPNPVYFFVCFVGDEYTIIICKFASHLMGNPTLTISLKTLPGHHVVKGLIVVRAKQAAVKCDLLQCNATGPFLSARLGRICGRLRVAPNGLCCRSDSLLRQPIQSR